MKDSFRIYKYLNPDLVLFLQEEERDAVLRSLVDAIVFQGKVSDGDAFYSAILEREKLVSTGIGIGVAIPHAKISSCDDFFVAIGIQKFKGISWDALDGSLVRLIFMIGGPDDQQTQYLRMLSKLTMSIKDEERRRLLLKCTRPEEVIALFSGL